MIDGRAEVSDIINPVNYIPINAVILLIQTIKFIGKAFSFANIKFMLY